MAAVQAYVQGAVEKLSGDFEKLSTGQKYAVGVTAGVSSLYLLKHLISSSGPSQKPTSFELSGGSISKDKVNETFQDYSAAYGKGPGEGIKDRSRTVQLVDVFYSLVTDLYEWGWGQSFHFSPKLPHKDLKASEAAHETRIGAVLGLKTGMKALDCGCGVGGPMRTIAATSGAHITGITINQYQVDRATLHNKRVRLLAGLHSCSMFDHLLWFGLVPRTMPMTAPTAAHMALLRPNTHFCSLFTKGFISFLQPQTMVSTDTAGLHASDSDAPVHLQQGLTPLTNVVRGDFTSMPFPEGTYDGAYAIEATCHAPKVGFSCSSPLHQLVSCHTMPGATRSAEL